MGELFTDITNWMAAVSPLWAYGAILVIAYGENVIPPIPGDLVVVFGGYLVGVGTLDFWLVVLLATVGGAVGFMTMYAVGRRIGAAVFDPDRLTWLPKKQIHDVRHWIHRWGYGVVAANRFLSGARSVIALTVGMAEMNAWRTAAFATFSAAVWTFLITLAGYKVGQNWEIVVEYLRAYGRIVLALLLLVLAVQAVRYYRKRRRTEPEPSPSDEDAAEG